MLSLVGLLLLGALDISTVSVCDSGKDGDSPHEACYGWCDASQATDHCNWCKCRGCVWCARPTDGASPLATSALGTSTACTSSFEDDVGYRDCQTFCSSSEGNSHCGMCKCKACGFCACSSNFEEDSLDAQCEPWCAVDYYHDHCSRCKCKACDFCQSGPPCTPTVADDITHEECQAFCSREYADSHCDLCKCKGCDFCAAPGSATSALVVATCQSGIEDDVHTEMCQDFCDPRLRQDHCSLCKCRGCDFCACESSHANDSKAEICQPWCNENHFGTHCDYCSCKGCRFCRIGGKPCQSFFLTGDTDHEACEAFCSESAADVHCSYCKCKDCSFCKHKTVEEESLAPIPSDARACFSGVSQDVLYETCESFCDTAHTKEHCKLCKCKGCSMCRAICNSGIPGDTHVEGCSSSCDPTLAPAVCSLCKCRGCEYCKEGGTSIAAALPAATSDTRAACVPLNSKDIDHAACLDHCSEASKASHCETCKCKGCPFCQGFRACSSGLAHDTKWEDCDKSCSGRSSCNLCKCRKCDVCSNAVSIACHSGIVGDAQKTACLAGACSVAYREAHCQMCSCKACSFCEDYGREQHSAPPPPTACFPVTPGDTHHQTCDESCRPTSNHCSMCRCKTCSFCTDTAQPCTSMHLADADSARCDAFCLQPGHVKELTCSFCSCKGCDACAGQTDSRSFQVRVSGTACPIGTELMVLSERSFRKGWHYDAKLRVGDWQPGALVTIDFSNAHDAVEIDPAQIRAATFKWDKEASFQVELARYADEMGGMSFGFTVFKGRFDQERGPSIACTEVHPIPPSRPHPPPPPHRPYSTSASVQVKLPRNSLSQCALGGSYQAVSVWNGGSSYRGRVVMAVWRAGAEVTLDFSQHAPSASDVSELGATHATYATILEASRPGSLRFRLNESPDETNGFSFVGHGGQIHDRPVVTCSLVPQVASAMRAPPSASELIGPTCAPLGLSYSMSQKWQGGFKALVAVRSWMPGARVELRYPGKSVSLNDHWSVTPAGHLAGSDGIALLLGDHPDEEHHGFGFSARGDAAGDQPRISCELDPDVVGFVTVPGPSCGMGASYRVVPRPEAPDAATVRVRISQWQEGAIVNVAFASEVETVLWPTSATETSRARASVHSFTLGSHPDDDNGLTFEVRSGGVPHLMSVTCRPKPSEDEAAADRQVNKGTPEGPMAVKAKATGCDTIDVSWHAAVDNGFSVKGYKIYYRRREAGDQTSFDVVETHGVGTSISLNGLSGGTTYLIKVRGRNAQGEGKYSERVSATTDSAGAPQMPPKGLEPLQSPDCSSITLVMPKLRAGCHGESFHSLQMRSFTAGVMTPWADAVPMVAEATSTVHDLSPWDVYEFRVTPHNSVGPGPPSSSTGLVMVEALTQVLAPPTVVAVSSASFSLKWTSASSPCRPSLRWRITYTKDVRGSIADAAWHELVNNATGSTFVAYPLRCPSPGCMFRVQFGAPSVGWSQPSAPSSTISSLPLPPPAPGSVRFEMRLRTEQQDRDMLQMRQDVAADITNVLHISSTKVAVQDVYGAGRYIVVQLNDATQTGNGAPTRAHVLVEQLAVLAGELRDGQTGGLESCKVARELDSTFGVRVLASDGRLTAVRVSSEARDSLARLPRYYGEASKNEPVLAMAKNLTVTAALVGLMLYCCHGMYRHSTLVNEGRATNSGYGYVAPDDCDTVECDDAAPTRSGRRGKRRSDRDRASLMSQSEAALD